MTRTLIKYGETLTVTLLSLSLLLSMTPPTVRAVETSRVKPSAARTNTHGPGPELKKTIAQLPSVFEENVGQAGGRVRFLSRGAHASARGRRGYARPEEGRREGGLGPHTARPGAWGERQPTARAGALLSTRQHAVRRCRPEPLDGGRRCA